MFNWDGSDLGKVNIIDSTIDGIKITMKIIKDPINDYLSIIIDEFKPLFGLKKIGSHICTFEGKKYIIFKDYEDSTTLSEYIKDLKRENLKTNYRELIKNDELFYQIKKIYIFRLIMGICNNKDLNILLIYNNNGLLPISINESKIDFNKDHIHTGNTLSNVVLKNWFDSRWYNVFNLYKELFTENSLIRMERQFTNIIDRINPQSKYIINPIMIKMEKIFKESEFIQMG